MARNFLTLAASIVALAFGAAAHSQTLPTPGPLTGAEVFNCRQSHAWKGCTLSTLSAWMQSNPNTWGAKQTFQASTVSGAGLNIGQGAAPASPVNGDLWSAGTGVFVELGGTIYQLGGAAFGVSSLDGRAGAVILQSSDVTNALTYTPANGASYAAASDFGVSTGNADNSAAFNAIDAAGKVAVLAPGIYNIQHTIAFSHSYTGIVCASNGGFAVSTTGAVIGYPGNGCWIKWATGAASGGTMMTITAPVGTPVANFGRLRGNIVKGINFDGNTGLAANGLGIYSEIFGTFDTISLWNLSGGRAMSLDINPLFNNSGSNFGEPPASQWNKLSNIAIGPGLANEVGFYLDWASFNTISNMMVQESGADGVEVVGSDNNHFYNLVSYENSATSGYGLHFMVAHSVGVTSGVTFASTANSVWGYSGSVQRSVYADGQTANPGCTSWTNGVGTATCTSGNYIYGLDKANSVPDPVVEPGANVIWTNNDGTKGGTQMSGGLAIGDTYANQIGAGSDPSLPLEGLHIRNHSQDHIVLDDAGGAFSWGIHLDGSGNLNILPASGGVLRTGFFSPTMLQDAGFGTPTTNTGTCNGMGVATGGAIAGKFSTTAVCSAGNSFSLLFPYSAPHNWICYAQDVSNTAVNLKMSFSSAAGCSISVLSASTGASDTIMYTATAF